MAKESQFKSESSKLPKHPQGMGGLILKSQLRTKPFHIPSDTNLSGQTAIITGSNIGLGLECASMLLEFGLSHLIVAVRSQAKGDQTVKTLRARHPSSKAQIDVFVLDMASYSSIQDFSKRCSELPRIDFVILNAGITVEHFNLSGNTGHEEAMQINFLSTMLLTFLLLPVLKNAAPTGKPGRLTIVNSGMAMHAKFPTYNADPIIPSFDDQSKFDPVVAYGLSKFLSHLIIDKLASFVSPDDVVVNLVDPGLTKGTGLHRSIDSVFMGGMIALMKSFAGRTLRDGASTYVQAAIVMGKETHGSFLMDWKIYPYGEFYYHKDRPDVQQRLWNELMREFDFAKVEDMVESMKPVA